MLRHFVDRNYPHDRTDTDPELSSCRCIAARNYHSFSALSTANPALSNVSTMRCKIVILYAILSHIVSCFTFTIRLKNLETRQEDTKRRRKS